MPTYNTGVVLKKGYTYKLTITPQTYAGVGYYVNIITDTQTVQSNVFINSGNEILIKEYVEWITDDEELKVQYVAGTLPAVMVVSAYKYKKNPFVFDDGRQKTMVFNERTKRWTAPHTIDPDWMERVGVNFFSFKNGLIYKHTPDAPKGYFFGERNRSALSFYLNANPGITKVLNSVAVEGSDAPDFIHFRSEKPREQGTELVKAEFVDQEGVYYESIKRDRLTPDHNSTTYSKDQKRLNGDPMRGDVIGVTVEYNIPDSSPTPPDGVFELRAIDIDYSVSKGHKTV